MNRCAASLLLLGLPALGEPVACPGPSGNSGRLCIKLRVKDGKFAAGGDRTLVRGRIPATLTEAALVAEFEKALASLDYPYRVVLSEEEKKTDALTPTEQVRSLQSFSGPWQEYTDKLLMWADATEHDFTEALDGQRGPLSRLKDSSPFVLLSDSNLSFEADSGIVRFDVPVLFGDAPIRIAAVAKPEARVAALRKYLRPLLNQPWAQGQIVGRIAEYYSYFGLTPTVIADGQRGVIEIVEGTRLARITLPLVDERTRLKALYAVLEDRDFRRAAQLPPAASGEAQIIDYVRDLGRKVGEEPYFFASRAQIQQLLLAQFDLAMQPLPAGSQPPKPPSTLPLPYVALRVAKPDAGTEQPKPAPALADDQGLIQPHLTEGERQSALGPEVLENMRRQDRERNNYLGAGLNYTPGQGVSVLGLYQRDRLQFPLRDSSFGVRVSRTGDNLIAPSANYFADYVFFEKLRRRVSLQLNGSSDAEANRFLGGAFQNERRSGGLGRVEIEPFRDLAGSLLRFQIEGARFTVTRTLTDQVELKQNLTTADFGALWMTERRESLHPWRLNLQPVFRKGLGVGSQTGYSRFRMMGDSHVQLERGFELDWAGSFQRATSATPIFELPSLGGAESVRGFRRDDAIGQTLWTIQNELWTPLPFTSRVRGERGDFFRKMMRLAFFGDVGGVQQAAANYEDGTRAGVGMGLRLNFNPVILKLDYAYGFGPAATGGSRGKFYFTVKTNLPF